MPKPTEAHKFRNERKFGEFASRLAQEVLANGQNHQAVVVALAGELGSGKTTFTKYFLKALGVIEGVTSPTFLIMRPHKIEAKNFTTAYHFDWYRTEAAKEILALGYENILANPNHILLIEWADKFRSLVPKHAIWLELQHGKGKTERVLLRRN